MKKEIKKELIELTKIQESKIRAEAFDKIKLLKELREELSQK